MTSTSCEEIARDLLSRCIAGNPPRELPRELLDPACAGALFGVFVEGLADRFDPALCDAYAELFSQAIAGDSQALVDRYRRVRRVRPVRAEPRRVVVLSRVTLGADVAVTSVLLAAAKERFPQAEIVFAGPAKNYELYAGDPRISHAVVEYRREKRLVVWDELRTITDAPGTLVLDPDSRLTQLGLLPIGDEAHYRFFESRAYGSQTDRALPELAADWVAETLGVSGARPYIALGEPPVPGSHVAISLGVGGNPAKRLPDPFEENLLRLTAEAGHHLWIDRGAGGEEAGRVTRAVERSGAPAQLWDGSFAGFSRIIAGAQSYIGYDSAGQHVAAACGIPLISIFAGFPVPRMFDRWKPISDHATVIRVDRSDPLEVLQHLRDILTTKSDAHSYHRPL